jgi:hypothetical protein
MTRLWSCAATGATPYFDDIAADLYSNANGRLRFREGKTGTINAVCDVQNVRDLASVRHLRITFRDAGRAPELGRVAAVLKKVHGHWWRAQTNGTIYHRLSGGPSHSRRRVWRLLLEHMTIS